MPELFVSAIGFALFIVLILVGMPIGFAFATAGAAGVLLVKGVGPALSLLSSAPYTWATNSNLLSLPLFILMGQFVFYSGVGAELFEAAYKWVGRLRGGVAIASVLASTAFGACCGVSMAGAAAMGTIAYPQMVRLRYDRRLACGAVAAGGSLSSLIPPSMAFIVYGFLTGTSVSRLFVAGILPGIVLTASYIAIISFLCWRRPEFGPAGPAIPLRERVRSLRGVAGALILFVLVMGSLFFGVCTPSEAGAIGAAGALALLLAKRGFALDLITSALRTAVTHTCMILTITIGAMIFSNFLAAAGFAAYFKGWVAGLAVSRHAILISILAIYVALGCVMDTLAMMLLTMPIVFPVVASLGADPVWFGVMVTLVGEMGLLTPPVGMVAYVVSGITNTRLEEVFSAIVPFFVAMCIALGVLYLVPELALYLPSVMR
ncbi:MAG: TRAP transporter large permease [Clostridia bacterium]|nr:TRAP transporter large permease [Clostridia bacterium]